MHKVFVDTNVLLNPKFDFNNYEKIYISITSIEELDNLKSNDKLGYQARETIRNIINADNVEIKLCDPIKTLFTEQIFTERKNDNLILNCAKDVYDSDNEVVMVSCDYAMILKARGIELPCEMFELGEDDEEKYSGIKELILTDREYVDLFEKHNYDLYNFYPNEYIIMNEKYLFMWNGKNLEEVKIKPISNKYLNKIVPLDVYQKAFIHMLQNENIKIKITDSIYGSGKSFLMIHWALQMLEKEKFNRLYFVKSDSPPKGRKEFPAIPGDVNDKCESMLGLFCDITSEDNLTEILLRNNSLEILPIQFAKGRSLQNAILYINECQDFTPSEMERLLSRLGEKSVALLDGSTKQIDNKNCLYRNGLTVTSNNFKNEYDAAQVNMVEDFRSEVSKKVSKMNWKD